MATPEGALPSASDVSGNSTAATSDYTSAGSSPAPAATGTSSADVTAQQPVQGTTQTQEDPLAGIPTIEEAQQSETVSREAFLRLRGEYDKVAPQFKEIQPKWESYSPVLDRFENPEQLQGTLELYDNLIGYERDGNELVPSTQKGAAMLSEKYPLHADYLAADLLNGQTTDPVTGQRMSRMDVALSGLSPSAIGNDPSLQARRAEALRLLGAVEPSSISPQWQPTQEELEVVRPELQDVYKRLPFEEREELKLASPDYINRTLEREKLTQELQARDQQTQQQKQQEAQAREQYVAQQATQAGEQHLQSLLNEKLTTFHNSVVSKCNFIAPIDPQAAPQGMTAEQVQQMNAQIDQSNKAEAAQITGLVVALQNEQTRAYVLPLLQQIGVIDDKFLKEMESAGHNFGANARNYGELSFRGRMGANGNGYNPDASVTALANESNRHLARLTHYANQLADRLIERRAQFFALKAQDHNNSLNSPLPRPSVTGSAYNPTTAAAPRPQGWATRDELERQFG